MLISLGFGSSADDRPKGPFDLLLDCHTRIRRSTSLSVALASTPEALPTEIANVSAQLLRYFELALPLHTDDEDFSLTEALRPHSELSPLIADLTAQHRAIEETLAPLLASWRELKAGAVFDRAVLLEGAQRLRDQFERHLRIEEEELFPKARLLLDVGRQGELLREFRARRSSPEKPR